VILDTSLLLASLQRGPGWERHQQALEAAEVLRLSAGTLQELLVVAHRRGVLEPMRTLLELIDPDVVPVDAALAERDRLPLGFIGHDFTKASFFTKAGF